MRLLLHPLRAIRLLLKAEPRAPGSRGGHGYYTTEEHRWRYGQAPTPGERLPEDHGRYFHLPTGTVHLPLDQLDPLKGLSGEHAERTMRAAAGGTGGKRGPLLVTPPNAQGVHAIVNGSGAHAVAVRHGWATLPARIVKPVAPNALDQAVAREHLQRCPTCRARAQLHPACAERLARATQPRLVLKAAPFAKPAPPAGQHTLGKTKSGKPVFASGAESAKFSDDDHHDAARLHHGAGKHHAARAGDHHASAEKDDDWRRSESSHTDADRHRKLAEHHDTVAEDHLVAAGRGSHAQLVMRGGKPVITAPTPAGGKEQTDAKKRLAARSHHDHPGGTDDRDTAAYAALEAKA